MGVEHVDDLGEIGERPGQAVDLVDDDDLNLAGLDVGQQPLQGRALHRAAGEAAVVIHVGKRDPAGMTLAHDIGLASFPLGVERVELLLEPIVGRFARVDRAAESLRRTSDDQASACSPSALSTERPAPFLKPKKRGPDQWAPVISRATMVSDR